MIMVRVQLFLKKIEAIGDYCVCLAVSENNDTIIEEYRDTAFLIHGKVFMKIFGKSTPINVSKVQSSVKKNAGEIFEKLRESWIYCAIWLSLAFEV